MSEEGIPWPIWSDDDLSNETWGKTDTPTAFHQDPQSVNLPFSLKIHQWKRFHEIENVKPILYDPLNSPDLFINNQHLFHSEYMRWFCSALTILNNYHEIDGQKWQGWFHIYSSNKPPKGSKNDPQVNIFGKYIIRLFFMGFWRRLETDDAVPFDEEGLPLLPRTQNVNELWPLILAKVVWKIASVTAMGDEQLIDFNLFSCFTGWSLMSCNMTSLTPKESWTLLSKYSSKFDSLKINEKEELASVSEISKDEKKGKKEKRKSKELKKRKSKSDTRESNVLLKKEDFSVLTLLCLSNVNPDALPEISPMRFPMCIESTSDLPEDPTQIKPPLENWKFHRWVPWAIRQGIMDPKEYFTPTRRALVFIPSRGSKEWINFNELGEYPMSAYFLFKIGYFKCTINVTNIPTPSPPETKKPKGKEPPKIPENSENYFYSLKKCRNEALYLFVDSTDAKFFLFNYSACGKSGECIVEQHSWFKIDKTKELMKIRSRGFASKGFCLDPGRHLLKITCLSTNIYHLKISSDSFFYVGDREKIQNLMTSESERTKVLANEIKTKLIAAVDSFGSPEFPVELRNYYKSYIPRNHRFNDCFEEIMIDFIEKKGEKSSELIRSFRIFFVNPNIGRGNLEIKRSSSVSGNSRNSEAEVHEADFSEEMAAVKIQSFFRMIRIKKFLEIHKNHHKDHQKIKNILKNMTIILGEEIMCNILHEFIRQNEEVRGHYPCSSDFDKILEIQKMRGTVPCHQWTPIIRRNLKVSEDEVVFAVMDLFVDLPVHVLKVFDNNSEMEIQRVVHNVMPFHYEGNEKGFTVFGYGWADDNKNKELEWTLHLTTVKGFPRFVASKDENSSLKVPSPRIFQLSNTYIPNSVNSIAQLILKISENSNVSIKFHTSYQNAKMKLQILAGNSVIREVSGQQAILLPIVDLDKDIEYFIKVYVLEDSWPLTGEEWKIVKKWKKNFEDRVPFEDFQNSSAKSLFRGTSDLSEVEESPYWRFQVLLDPEVDAELHQDVTQELTILKIKRSRQSEDSTRLERGKKIREKFYSEICIDHYDTESLEHDNVLSKTTLFTYTGLNEEIRGLNSPQDYDKIPSLDFTSFVHEFTIKTALQEEIDKKIENENLLKFQRKLRHLMQHLEMVMISSLRIAKN